jgi:hypothetical protein
VSPTWCLTVYTDSDDNEDDDDGNGDPELAKARQRARHSAWDALLHHDPMRQTESDEDAPAEDVHSDDDEDSEGTDSNSESSEDEEMDRSAWEELVEEIEHAGRNPEDLSPLTMAALRAFALKVTDHLSEKTFAKLPHAFPRDCRMSWKQTRSLAEKISGFKPEKYDMCPDSCVLYVGPYAHLRECPKPKCGKDRYDSRGRPMKQFTYLPLIP